LFFWFYGSQMQAILARYDRVRYRMLPYIYSVAWKTTSENYTQMRALAMDFRDDPRVLNIGDPFLFGPSLLVNPVTEPGATTRHLYLPKDNWYSFWTSESVEGGRAIDTPAPLEEMPIFVRAGAILPMEPNIEYAQQPSNDPLEIRVYAGADGDFTLTKKRATRMTMRRAPLQRFRFIGMRRRID
jgi:alpha-D-xyloside xylohydrolase